MIDYLITSHAHLDGVRLSRRGDWGNIPHNTEEEARAAAHEDAKGKPYTIERRRLGLPRRKGG